MKTTWNVITLPVLILLCVGTAQADFVGFKIGANYWEPELSGAIKGDGVTDTPINLTGDLALDDPTPSNLVLTLEHPVPLLPNLKYQNIELDSTGSNVHSGFTFNDTIFLPGNVNSTFDLSHNDIVLYYEILDNWISLDFGLDIKIFDGEVFLTDGGATTESVLIDETIPMLYLSARFELPFSGFYIGADINGASSGDNDIEDSSIMLGYESEGGLGFEGGIKKFSLELNDVTDVNANVEYDGIYLNGYYHF